MIRDEEIELLRGLILELEATGKDDGSRWWALMARLVELEVG